jgi:alpha-amylase
MESTDVKFAVGEFWDTLSYDYDQPQYNQVRGCAAGR